jgi:hypothetical protein
MKAFPSSVKDGSKPYGYFHGMDLRDYFAAQAMQAFLTDLTHKEELFLLDEVADTAYQMADAMMKAREQ